MIEKIKTLKIKGGIFNQETKLDLFSKITSNFSLIYGKNGSGKSTISKAFRKIKEFNEKQIEIAEIFDENDNIIQLTDKEKNSIYVFNEEFIEDKIRIDDDGLHTIIVMGAVKDADDQLKTLQPLYIKSSKDKEVQSKIVDIYSDSKNEFSPQYYIEKMKECLRGNNSWASRDSKIRGNKTNSSVNSDTYKKFIKLEPSHSRDELILDYDSEIKKLEAAKTGSEIIDVAVPQLEKIIIDESDITNLLKKNIEKPNLSDREKRLFLILKEDEGYQKLHNIKSYFTGSGKKKCSFCFQDVNEIYANDLIKSIEKILSKEVDQHQYLLKNKKLPTFEIDLSPFKELSPEKVKNCEEKLENLNSTIKRINKFIDQKIGNVYEPVLEDGFQIQKRYEECQRLLSEIESIRIEFNNKTVDTTSIIENLKTINNEIAYYDIKELHEKYSRKLLEKENERLKLERLTRENERLQKLKDNLEKQKKNAHIAMDAINDDLSYIFFSSNRLKIEYKHNKYILYSHGKPVEPGNLSVGERNVLGLCYFFSHIMESKNEEDIYNTNYLIIIDDPISSFDMGNRIGIISYLKYKLGQYLEGNENSKFIILTHDMQTISDINHSMSEIVKSKYIHNKSKRNINVLELDKNALKEININIRNEYTSLLETVFDYATEIDSQYSPSIGNIMRKVMEAFGTFLYKKGISELSTDKDIMSNLPKEDCKYYENLMYRLVLNTGSHMSDKVKTINDMNFFDYISEEEKQRTARDIICFLYKLNPLHIKSHLKNKKDAEISIKKWQNY
ncbi:AAA family ATPase [Streptococcus zalophi]|uniref:AAA family ATPase n=1 Tax=Streptococcus zalophi TaxID=640031 RepID=UPI00215B9E33|nr:AAA family ATPase [Streptococcus zalophi]MCR8968236.1 AAA family ATPase [Streptococcus zalophi]